MQITIAIWNKNIVNFCMSWLLRPVHKAGGQFDSPLQLLRKDFLHFSWLNTCVKNFPMIWWKENYHKKINTQNSYSWVPNNRPTHFFSKTFPPKTANEYGLLFINSWSHTIFANLPKNIRRCNQDPYNYLRRSFATIVNSLKLLKLI